MSENTEPGIGNASGGCRPLVPMQTARVAKVIQETPKVKTLELACALVDAKPGQYLMVWVPGVGERPISIVNDNPLTITVANVGKVSGALHRLKKDDLLSFRGPLGKGFVQPEGAGRILLVGGGYGVAPLYFLAKEATEAGFAVEAVVGARSRADVMFERRLALVAGEVFVTTDDGSKGKKGTVMEEIEWLLRDRKYECIFGCGPERMLHALAERCNMRGVPCQVSLERYMKCGLGVCGSCDIGGRLVCRDGPVFDGKEALALVDFGKTKREASGKKAHI